MPSTTVTALAEQAATAVHDLARLTRPAITTLEIHELQATTGVLVDLIGALPQTLRQLRAYLAGSHDTGDVVTGADQARDCLHQAAALAAHLTTILDAAHQALGDLAETTETTPGGSVFNRR